MPDLKDLFLGFATHWIDTNAGKIFARSHGDGPPLLLLHGFPQTHVMWHKIAARLAERFKIVVMDLRGYGWSTAPASVRGEHYTKRLMAEDAIEVMQQLGHVRFSVAGHDRADESPTGSRLITLSGLPPSPCSISSPLLSCGNIWTRSMRSNLTIGFF